MPTTTGSTIGYADSRRPGRRDLRGRSDKQVSVDERRGHALLTHGRPSAHDRLDPNERAIVPQSRHFHVAHPAATVGSRTGIGASQPITSLS